MIIKNVTKSYNGNRVLQNFSLKIREGKITALLGESGAGKTTLLNVIAGLTDYSGSVSRANCSYVFQQARLLPNLTARDNLKFVLPKDQWCKIPDMLSKVGLAGKEKRYPAQLSGGEAKRVSVARAFLYPHDLLLMDEPFSSIDLSLKKDLIDLVVNLQKERGDTILFVTHDIHERAVLAHRTIVMKKGKITFDTRLNKPLPRDFYTTMPEESRLIEALSR